MSHKPDNLQSVTRVNRLDAIVYAYLYDRVYVQVLSNGAFASIKFKGLVSLVSVLSEAIYDRKEKWQEIDARAY
jgi:hypothetical protein